jgi:hypothetical protein
MSADFAVGVRCDGDVFDMPARAVGIIRLSAL